MAVFSCGESGVRTQNTARIRGCQAPTISIKPEKDSLFCRIYRTDLYIFSLPLAKSQNPS